MTNLKFQQIYTDLCLVDVHLKFQAFMLSTESFFLHVLAKHEIKHDQNRHRN